MQRADLIEEQFKYNTKERKYIGIKLKASLDLQLNALWLANTLHKNQWDLKKNSPDNWAARMYIYYLLSPYWTI